MKLKCSLRTVRRQSGFTLVELLLVMVILGTLAAIVLPKLAGRGEQAKVTATGTQISNFGTALDAFEVDNGHYPRGRAGLQDLVVQPREEAGWKGPYLPRLPKDSWQHDFIYLCPGKHNESGYDLYSAGPDGQEGNDDDITNWEKNGK